MILAYKKDEQNWLLFIINIWFRIEKKRKYKQKILFQQTFEQLVQYANHRRESSVGTWLRNPREILKLLSREPKVDCKSQFSVYKQTLIQVHYNCIASSQQRDETNLGMADKRNFKLRKFFFTIFQCKEPSTMENLQCQLSKLSLLSLVRQRKVLDLQCRFCHLQSQIL